MNPASQPNCSLAAFTLMEVMLAVAVAAIVLAAINAVFFSAIKLRAGAAAAAESTLPVDRTVSTMTRDLAGIVPPGVMAGIMGSDIAGVGMTQPAALEFYTSDGILSSDTPWGPIQKIDYSLQDPTNRGVSTGKDLMRGVTRNLLASDVEPPEQHALISDVQTLQFSYYDGTNWNDSWSSTLSNIPIAIKVSIDFTAPRSGRAANPSVQFLVPIYAQARTNQTQVSD